MFSIYHYLNGLYLQEQFTTEAVENLEINLCPLSPRWFMIQSAKN